MNVAEPRKAGSTDVMNDNVGGVHLSRVASVATLWALLAALFACAPPSRPTPGVRSVFLIVVDTLRPDRLSCYGYEDHETPHIDALAAGGVVFERAQAVASWTVPSVGSMMTSLYPAQLGLVETPAPPGQVFEWRERRGQLGYTIPLAESTLAELMRAAGFYTAAFVNQPMLGLQSGWQQGFEEWFFPLESGRVVRSDLAELPRPRPGSPTVAAQNDVALVESFRKWSAANLDQKVFVWLHLLQPHRPYNPDGRRPESTASERYDLEVRAADEAVGRIISIIDVTVGLEESLIVFVSDHGEAFNEHGMSEHGHSLHGEVTRVPLIMSSGSLPAGQRVGSYVRTIDIVPTVLELAGIGVSADLPLEGTSLLPVIRGAREDLQVFAQGMLYGSTEQSYLAGGYKLMFDEQRSSYELYHVAVDELERVDLASVRTDEAQRLREMLVATRARVLEQRDAGDGPEATAEEQRAVLQELRALGYISN